MTAYPKIYLAIDNCFAYKRWTRPQDWANIINDLGVKYIEASADTELDPLYMGEKYLKKWIDDVKDTEAQVGVKVANLYSGHGTYTTLGLSHTNKEIRERFINKWFLPMIDVAVKLNAGFGFLVHGFPEFVLQNKELYNKYTKELYNTLATINSYAKEKNCKTLSLEQMYSPQMIPWTIKEAKKMMYSVSQNSGKEFYFTEDTGHHHTKFIKPTREYIVNAFSEGKSYGIWLGSDEAFNIYYSALCKGKLNEEDIQSILQNAEENKRFFSSNEDNNCYTWLEKIGYLAPIIHLQQTNGKGSNHLSFTEEHNANGIVKGDKVLNALKKSYDRADSNCLKCSEIYLTLELFYGASTISKDMLYEYKKSVEYWRKFIVKDGMRLDELVELWENKQNGEKYEYKKCNGNRSGSKQWQSYYSTI